MNLENQQTYDYANLLKAVAHPVRLCLVKNMLDGEKNVTYFVNCLDASQANISQHLAILRAADVVSTRKEKNEVFYSIKDSSIRGIVELLYYEK
ncbi:MAG: winged helix-turn-helix transcriptional regulator [Erysipelothrix sp.]|nr:winged helix-turn-helix transcriptional regulator [Erysipelothrix sp.]